LSDILKVSICKWRSGHVGLRVVPIDDQGKNIDDKNQRKYYALLPKGLTHRSIRATGFNLFDSLITAKSPMEAALLSDYTTDRWNNTSERRFANAHILSEIQKEYKKITENNSNVNTIDTIINDTNTLSLCDSNVKALFEITESLINNYKQNKRIDNFLLNHIGNNLNSLIKEQEKNGIKQTLKDNVEYFVRKPEDKYYLYPGGGLCKRDGIRQWFGIKPNRIDSAASYFRLNDNKIHHNKQVYYKTFSRYHNCIGYVRYLLENAGIKAFKDTSSLEVLGITDPSRLEKYMAEVNKKLFDINQKANILFNNVTSSNARTQDRETTIKDLKKLNSSSYLTKYESSSDITTKIKALSSLISNISKHSVTHTTRNYLMRLTKDLYS
jgi:uncharacterized protein YlxW (UPF0749 family)